MNITFQQVLKREHELLKTAPTEVLAALALSGGGVRAAMVSRGVLDALKKDNLLEHFTYVSAVSGGGYAASEMLEELSESTVASRSFEAPGYRKYGASMAFLLEFLTRLPWLVLIAALFIPFTLNEISSQKQNYWPLTDLAFELAASVFTATVLMRWGIATFLARMPHKKVALRRYRHFPRAVIALVLIFWMYCYFAALVAKDPSLSIYITWQTVAIIIGIFAVPFVSWASHKYLKMEGLDEPLFAYYRHHLKKIFARSNKDLTSFANGQRPYPIFNVTANNNDEILPFELTPIACGAASTYYVATESLPRSIKLADAMAISGSAVDLVNHEWSWLDVLSIFSGGTGSWFPHYFSKKLTWLDKINVSVKMLTNVPSKRILRLYDGGFTDNLGMIALLRRRVKLIVCVDAAYDPEFLFEDLRTTCSFAESEHLAVIDSSPVQQMMHDLRFVGDKVRFVKLNVTYSDPDESAIIIYIKLAARAFQPIRSRKTFSAFPQITTDDQLLTPIQMEDLYEVGKQLAAECIEEVKILMYERPENQQDIPCMVPSHVLNRGSKTGLSRFFVGLIYACAVKILRWPK